MGSNIYAYISFWNQGMFKFLIFTLDPKDILGNKELFNPNAIDNVSTALT